MEKVKKPVNRISDVDEQSKQENRFNPTIEVAALIIAFDELKTKSTNMIKMLCKALDEQQKKNNGNGTN